MNIFYLDSDPTICAQYHCDKHVVKMIVEYAQLMSTAHRLLDGTEYVDNSSGRRIKRWKLNDQREDIVYKASHINHPSAVWTRDNLDTYNWLYTLWANCLNEYTHRYGKQHACEKLRFALVKAPKRIKWIQGGFFEPPQAMPDECKVKGNSIFAYRQYYVMKKNGFARWTNRNIPGWYTNGVMDMLLADRIVSSV